MTVSVLTLVDPADDVSGSKAGDDGHSATFSHLRIINDETNPWGAMWRFVDTAGLPNKAIIHSAFLSVFAQNEIQNDLDARAHYLTNPGAGFTSDSTPWNTPISTTSTVVSATDIGPYTGEDRTNIPVTSLVSEVVSFGGWAPGGWIGLALVGFEQSGSDLYTPAHTVEAPERAAQLIIEWDDPGIVDGIENIAFQGQWAAIYTYQAYGGIWL